MYTKQKRDLKFMKKKFSSLALLVTLSTAIASQDQISTEETEEQKVRQKILSFSEDIYHLPTPTYTVWPPRDETGQPLRLSELFSSDTGHTQIDDKANELKHILLRTEERIAKFRLLSEDTQIKTAVAFSRLACNIAGDIPGILNTSAFTIKCAELLSGKDISFTPEDLVYKLDFCSRNDNGAFNAEITEVAAASVPQTDADSVSDGIEESLPT